MQKAKTSGGGNIVIKVIRGIFNSILAVSTIGLLFVYLLSAFSDHFDPRTYLYVAFLGIGYHIALILTVLWLIVLVVLRHWKLAALAALCLISTYSKVSRYFPMNILRNDPITKVRSAEGLDSPIQVDTIRLMTYNTCGSGQVAVWKKDVEVPVLDFLRNSKADILCLQEHSFAQTKNGHSQEEMRKYLADIYPYYDFMPNYSRETLGIAIFSKFPIKKMARIDKSKKDYASSMYYELDIKGRRVALINNHLHSNQIELRDRELYDEMLEHFDKDSLGRIRTGMMRSLGNGYRARASQSNLIKNFIAERIGNDDIPVIICGDMNDTPISYCYRTMRGDYEDAWQNAGLGSGTTYNQHHFWFRIDHVFHTSHFRTLDIQVLKRCEYSDHYPVMVNLQLLPESK